TVLPLRSCARPPGGRAWLRATRCSEDASAAVSLSPSPRCRQAFCLPVALFLPLVAFLVTPVAFLVTPFALVGALLLLFFAAPVDFFVALPVAFLAVPVVFLAVFSAVAATFLTVSTGSGGNHTAWVALTFATNEAPRAPHCFRSVTLPSPFLMPIICFSLR